MTHEEELIELLDKETTTRESNTGDLLEQQKVIEKTFSQYGVMCKIMNAGVGPQVNCFEFAIEDIASREHLIAFQADICDEIKRTLGKKDNIRLLPPMPNLVGCSLEIPNGNQPEVTAGELFRSKEWRNWRAILPLMLGKGWAGEIRGFDLARAPHLLMAGSTGSGKSVFIDSCLCSLMFKHTPDELKLILVDPKAVEFTRYENIPYLQFPVINSSKDVLMALQWLMMEMERRFVLLSEAGVRDIQALNEFLPETLPYIVMIIDELSDFMRESRSQMESLLSRICARSRAAGIHVILSTQRPSPDVLTVMLKTNFPTRIAFHMASCIDSRTFIGSDDAAFLVGCGDMLFRGPCGEALSRIQCPIVKPEESARIVERLQAMYKGMKSNALTPMRCKGRNQTYVLRDNLCDIARDVLEDKLDWLKEDAIDEACEEIADSIIEHWDELKKVDEEAMLLKAIQIVIETKRTSISYIQRNLRIGYNSACVLMEAMERYGIVSPLPANGNRSILVDSYEEAICHLQKMN